VPFKKALFSQLLSNKTSCLYFLGTASIGSLLLCHLGHEEDIISYVRFEVFMVVTMKNAVFQDVTMHGTCKNWCFLRSIIRLLVTANVAPTSPILVTLMMEVICSSETLVLTRATQRHIPEDGIIHHSPFLCCAGSHYLAVAVIVE
jgi:hypothetical protein